MSRRQGLSALETLLVVDHVRDLVRHGQLGAAAQILDNLHAELAREARPRLTRRATKREILLRLLIVHFGVARKLAIRSKGRPTQIVSQRTATSAGLVRQLWETLYPEEDPPEDQTIRRALKLLGLFHAVD